MRVAVAGGTGLIGRMVVAAVRAQGHEPVVLSRARGTDLLLGDGLAGALTDTEAIIDVANSGSTRARAAREFFETTTTNLLAAGSAVGVKHHLALSIVGVDRVPWGYYRAKARQEELVAASSVPWTLLRATQFHEFPVQLLARTPGPVVPVPRMRSATVAAREVAARLVELVVAGPQGRAPDMSGPEIHAMPDLARRVLQADGRHATVVPVRVPGAAGKAMAGDGLLPLGAGTVGVQTFEEWLAQRPAPSADRPV